MHAQPDPYPPTALLEGLVARLATLLESRGLTVVLERDGTVDVRNPAGAATDPVGRVLHPGLNQRITVVERDDGFWWAWLWTGPERDAPLEPEPMVPAGDVEEAARRVGNVLRVGDVLRVDDPDGTPR